MQILDEAPKIVGCNNSVKTEEKVLSKMRTAIPDKVTIQSRLPLACTFEF